MKKHFMFAACLAAGFMVSCSNDDKSFTVTTDDSQSAPIMFTLGGNAVDVTTRGTGAVGDVDGDKNIWRGEKLNVYMFNKGTFTIAGNDANYDEEITADEYLFENTEITANNSDNSSVVASYEGNKYYPMTGNYDFFAYYADDAVQGAPAESGDKYVIPVVIDGSQDLMVAKADMPTAQKDAFVAAVGEDNKDRYYSAFSARRAIGVDGLADENGVQPHFEFNHLLSRFVFSVKPVGLAADNVDGKGVSVNAIKFKNAKTTADMTIASYAENFHENALAINDEVTADIYLQERVDADNASDLQALTPAIYSDSTKVGESLLVFPAEKYDMVIELSQMPDGENNYVFPYEHALSVAGGFKPGYQYNVVITIYSLEDIRLDVKLTPWKLYEDNLEVNNDLY